MIHYHDGLLVEYKLNLLEERIGGYYASPSWIIVPRNEHSVDRSILPRTFRPMLVMSSGGTALIEVYASSPALGMTTVGSRPRYHETHLHGT
jgi:hypothetical protein